MKFTCDSCSAQYMISDDKVGPNGVKVRCKKCGHIILVKRAPAEVPAAPAPAPAQPPVTEGGLDAELGQAFDNAFGEKPSSPAPAADAPDLSGDGDGEAPKEPPGQAPAAATPTEWYVAIDDKQVGPLGVDAVKSRWEAGDIGPDSLVWAPGMGDWKPLSGVNDLTQVLAPIPRPPPRGPEPAAAPRAAAPPQPAAAPEPAWQPSAASALAALASEEIAAIGSPEPQRSPAAAARPGDGVRSLVDTMNLPDAGGVDPTGAIPLPIKGLESTGEKPLKRKSLASTTAELRIKRSANRTILAVAAALAVLFAGGVGAVFWWFNHKLEAGAPAVATGPSPAPSPPPQVAAAPAAPAQATPPFATPPEPAPAPPPAAAAPAAPAPAPRQAAAEPAAPARRKKIPTEDRPARASRKGQRVAAAAPPAAEPRPEPRRKATGDPLLDFAGESDDLEKDLGSGSKKRSVYVPPAPGSDLPAEVSQAQIQEGVAGRMDGLRSCLEKQQAASPDSHGTLKLRWLIGGDGNVSGVRVLSPEFASQPIAPCLVGVVKSIRFPRSRTTGQEVVFPFKF